MIKFFRHMRHKLISENKTSNYLKYAIGEIVLVVIGILIALQINNWNESRKERKRESNYIELLTTDLISDANSLRALVELSDASVQSKTIILDYQDGIITKPDSLANHFLRSIFNGIASFVPNKGAIEEVQSAGGLSLFKNEEVRRQILKLYNEYDRLEKNIGQNYLENRNSMRQLVYDKANGNFFNRDISVDEDILNRLVSDSDIRNRLLNNWAVTYNNNLKEIIQINKETLKICKDYLQKLN